MCTHTCTHTPARSVQDPQVRPGRLCSRRLALKPANELRAQVTLTAGGHLSQRRWHTLDPVMLPGVVPETRQRPLPTLSPGEGRRGRCRGRGWAQGAQARESRLRAHWPRPGRRPLRRHWRTEGRSLRRTRPSEEAPPCPLPSSQRSASRSTVPWDASGTRFHPVSRGTHCK